MVQLPETVCVRAAMAPCITVSHTIDESSPLHGMTQEDFESEGGLFLVSLAATDDQSFQVHAITVAVEHLKTSLSS